MRTLVLALVLVAAPNSDRTATGGLILSDDCEQEACTSYTFEVSKKFVRTPIRRQLAIAAAICGNLAKHNEDYEYEDGRPLALRGCYFDYNGQEIMYLSADHKIYAETWYIASLAALRD